MANALCVRDCACVRTVREQGIGPAYSSKVGRFGVRVGDLRFPETLHQKISKMVSTFQRGYDLGKVDVAAETERYLQFGKQIDSMIVDGVEYLDAAYRDGRRIMIEGANATMLDLDHGTYPFVTSSNASIGGAITGLGIAPSRLDAVIGIMKAYTTRVGSGPFPTELDNPIGEKIRTIGGEFGVTTGRPRRCGWLDVVQMRYAQRINNFSVLNMTKLDVLSELDEIKVRRADMAQLALCPSIEPCAGWREYYSDARVCVCVCVQLAVRYIYNGKELTSFPANLEVLSKVHVEYETFPGWKCDISKVRSISDLPPSALRFVKRAESLIGVPIGWVRARSPPKPPSHHSTHEAIHTQIIDRSASELVARPWPCKAASQRAGAITTFMLWRCSLSLGTRAPGALSSHFALFLGSRLRD